ncbi:hypothetical protein OWM54_23130 [Myxococcus sp. MISCRS1]|uniref:hypothetical protein n=1 Tax=unclassified Myxococcus TaxID=2648731 RepID=UPI001CBFBB87|nr:MULTISPECIES: hypothetical protein [unclassified Myxococcus]MBZ4412730.1 hypothetical protein [Myxococcus sp. XM-1-1-1]MCY1000034.1 hypothetical protein [Myxococcus sp. MISCRS1]
MSFDIDRFRVEKRYRNTAPVSVLMEDLDQLGHLDEHMAEQARLWRRRRGWALRGFAGLVGLSFILRGFTEVSWLGGWAWWLGWLSLVGAVGLHLKASGYAGCDLEDRRYQLPARLLRPLLRDIDPQERVTLELDFQPIDHSSKFVRQGRTATGWETNEFEDAWMSLQARLRDGTHLRLSLTEWLQKRTRSRRNPRGKFKTKHKRKSATFLQAQLRVKPERHPGLAQMRAQAQQAVKLPPQVKLSRLDVTEDKLAMRAHMDSEWKVEPDATRACLMMLLSLFQVLHASSARGKHLTSRAS